MNALVFSAVDLLFMEFEFDFIEGSPVILNPKETATRTITAIVIIFEYFSNLLFPMISVFIYFLYELC